MTTNQRGVLPVSLVFMAGLLVGGCDEQPRAGVAQPQAEMWDVIFTVSPEVLEASRRQGLTLYAATPTVVFLNFDGVEIKYGNLNDASVNTSPIGRGGTMPAFAGTADQRAQVVAWVEQAYADFNVQFVTTRPSSGDYTMMVVGGTPEDINYAVPFGVVGVAPMDCSNRMPRDIGFAFAGRVAEMGARGAALVETVATTIAHEAGHTLGLPHTGDGCDIMSYSSCSGSKSFLDQTIPMQSDSYGQCGFTSINTHDELLAVLGAAGSSGGSTGPDPVPTPDPEDREPPQVVIRSPQNGATVEPFVVIEGAVSDDQELARVELLVDGELEVSQPSSLDGDLFRVMLAVGAHQLMIRAYDTTGNQGQAQLDLTVSDTTTPDPGTDPGTPIDPGSTPDTPTPGTDEQPTTPAAGGAFGAFCSGPTDCLSGLCATDGDDRYCTATCKPGAGCEEGASCVLSGQQHVCRLAGANALDGDALSGGCALAGGSDPPAPLWLLLLVALGLGRRRR